MSEKIPLTREKINLFFDAWITECAALHEECKLCKGIYASIEADSEFCQKYFVMRLSCRDGVLYTCPRCGQFYHYTSWMSSPDWGQCMSGITEPYEVEMIYKREPEQMRSWALKEFNQEKQNLLLLHGGPETERILSLSGEN